MPHSKGKYGSGGEPMDTVVSAGTERGLASFGGKNLIQKALERPDQVKKVMEKLSTDGIVTTIESAFNKLAEPCLWDIPVWDVSLPAEKE